MVGDYDYKEIFYELGPAIDQIKQGVIMCVPVGLQDQICPKVLALVAKQLTTRVSYIQQHDRRLARLKVKQSLYRMDEDRIN